MPRVNFTYVHNNSPVSLNIDDGDIEFRNGILKAFGVHYRDRSEIYIFSSHANTQSKPAFFRQCLLAIGLSGAAGQQAGQRWGAKGVIAGAISGGLLGVLADELLKFYSRLDFAETHYYVDPDGVPVFHAPIYERDIYK